MIKRVAGCRHVRGSITVPGDKAITHRAYFFNAMAAGEASITGFSRGDDCQSTLQCLRALGVSVDERSDSVTIRGVGVKGFKRPSGPLDVGNSGTTIRFLSGLLATQQFKSTITGDESLRRRPMDRVIAPLSLMGAQIEGSEGGKPPIRVGASELTGIEYELPVASAQVKTALLIAGCNAEGVTTVVEPVPSRNHTELLLGSMGANIECSAKRISIQRSVLNPQDLAVPGDISSAAYWIVLGVIHPDAEVTLLDVGLNPTRTGILDALLSMGADVAVENMHEVGGEIVGNVRARSSQLKGAVFEGELIPRMIDELPLIALAATLAQGSSEIRDAAELRVKESDRIVTTSSELRRLGARIEEKPDGLCIEGGAKLRGVECRAHGDHRIAMMLAIAALVAQGETKISDAEAADVSYPEFWSDLDGLAQDFGF